MDSTCRTDGGKTQMKVFRLIRRVATPSRRLILQTNPEHHKRINNSDLGLSVSLSRVSDFHLYSLLWLWMKCFLLNLMNAAQRFRYHPVSYFKQKIKFTLFYCKNVISIWNSFLFVKCLLISLLCRRHSALPEDPSLSPHGWRNISSSSNQTWPDSTRCPAPDPGCARLIRLL